MKYNGFTLVEMLIALVIGGLLLAALSTMISGLGNSLTQSNRANEQVGTYKKLSNLQQTLETASFVDKAGQPILQSEGHIRFRIRTPLAIGTGGWTDMQLMVKKTSKNKQLLLSVPSNLNIPDDILVNDAEDLNLDIGYATTGVQVRLVDMVAVTFQINGAEEYKIVAYPKITPESNCTFDLISQSCR